MSETDGGSPENSKPKPPPLISSGEKAALLAIMELSTAVKHLAMAQVRDEDVAGRDEDLKTVVKCINQVHSLMEKFLAGEKVTLDA
ncbi:hypothetical protein [Brevundimonas sp. GCM10030266]|uniref:hypothetical protein n=1 Tax=Brevundimonas sp. GCM10030266 TaxID=3273386 RepID=UPI00361B5193